MNRDLPKDWVKTNNVGRGLCVHYPAGLESWAWRGVDCWNANLSGLVEFRKSRAATVWRWVNDEDGRAYFIKRLHSRGVTDPLKHLLRPSRGMRALIEGSRLELLGFKAPQTVCLLERSCCGSAFESLLVTAEVTGVENVYDWFRESKGSMQEKRGFLTAYGAEVGRLHARGIIHGDMRKSNVLFRVDDTGYTFYWLDNERNRKYPEISFRKRIKNLTQVNMEREGVTLTDRMRFWKAYAEAAGVGTSDVRRLQQAVIARTRKRWGQLYERMGVRG